ncbi:hypothetical protein HAX54_025879 [Datura stramonium]|uniref:J domain-containing protein n=1 Tax=Datura stramonium TaxID=4076 RepID=A0ABS8V2A8_DATST|nr:hypothetical protein [Datura stramonium]
MILVALGIRTHSSIEEVNQAYEKLSSKWNSGVEVPSTIDFIKHRGKVFRKFIMFSNLQFHSPSSYPRHSKADPAFVISMESMNAITSFT